MLRPIYAVLLAWVLLLGWLGLVAYRAEGVPSRVVGLLAEAADRNHLPGLAAQGYLLSSELDREVIRAASLAHKAVDRQQIIRQIITRRLATARLLLEAGYPAAAERIALEAARADFADVPARVLLLEIRMGSERGEEARRELLRLLVRGEDPQLLVLLGRSFMQSKSYPDAQQTLQRAYALAPKHLPTLLALSELAWRQSDLRSARRWLDQAWGATATDAERVRIVAQRLKVDPAYGARPVLLRLWWTQHSVTVVVLLAYLLLLFSPSIFRKRAR
jgi:tetratricopeptide (TPR) repeat protein